jgi:uncharacterized delta-60 repeat protein
MRFPEAQTFPLVIRLGYARKIAVLTLSLYAAIDAQALIASASECSPLPSPSCLSAQRTRISIKGAGSYKQLLKWKWEKGEAFSHTNLGNPKLDTSYSLCFYDSSFLDSTFGGGVATPVIFGGEARGVAIQADGKVVVAVSGQGGIVASRNNVDGTTDSTFDGDGLIAGGELYSAEAIAIQGDGKIVIAGRSNNTSLGFAVARYNEDGSLDPSFAVDGTTLTDIPAMDDAVIRTIVIQSDGKILVGGAALAIGNSTSLLMVRYNEDGSLDNTFGGDGIVVADFANGLAEEVAAIDLQGDDKIVVAGHIDSVAMMMRFHTDGSVDGTFASGGIFTAAGLGTPSGGVSVAVQGDGKLLMAARTSTGNALVRLSSAGALDSTFNEDGTASLATNGYELTMSVQSDERILIAGHIDSDMVVARYLSDGSLDEGFGELGIVAFPWVRFGLHRPRSLAVRADNTAVLAADPAVYWNVSDSFSLYQINMDGEKSRAIAGWLDIAPSESWRDGDPRGWLYKDGDGLSDSVVKLSLRPGDDGYSRAELKTGRPGHTVAPSAFPLPWDSSRFFDQDPDVTVQLVNSDGFCLESQYGPSVTGRNESVLTFSSELLYNFMANVK